MMLARAFTVLLALALASSFVGCQPEPPQAPPTATVPLAATHTPTTTAATELQPTATSSPATATPLPSTPTPTFERPTASPPRPDTRAPSPASEANAPGTEYPTLAEVPETPGPIRTTIMDSRDHFPSQMRIEDVEVAGYNTVPPTSGRHWGAWSDCGFYNYPLPDELLVHNLEHGNIIVSYNLPDDSQVNALREAIDAIPFAAEYAIVRRYNRIPEGMVAVTTWGVLDRMMGVDAGRIAAFFRAFPGNTGPEFPNGLPCTTGVQMTDSSGG